MSILSIGASCATCHTVDFLPTPCPSCSQIFCSAHISTHRPCSGEGLGFEESNPIAGPSSFKARGVCEREGCGRMSIEGIGGLGGVGDGEEVRVEGLGGVKRDMEGERVAREVRCPGCGGAFCVEHRAQTSHDCSAPLLHNVRHDAFISRKAQAQAVLAKTFPDQAGRVIPKPPPPKDTSRTAAKPKPVPSSTFTTPTSIASASDTPGIAAEASDGKPRPKSKEEKLWEIHVRKIRSLSTPLRGAPSGMANEEKRYFEWGLCRVDEVRVWEVGGKWAGKVERSWVLASMPLGKLLDLMMSASKTPATKAPSGPSETWSLVLLDASPTAPKPRQAIPLRTDLPVGPQIPDGTTVVLCKGWAQGA